MPITNVSVGANFSPGSGVYTHSDPSHPPDIGEQVSELLVTEQRPEFIAHLHGAVAFPKGGLFRYIGNVARMQGHPMKLLTRNSGLGGQLPTLFLLTNSCCVDSPTASVTL